MAKGNMFLGMSRGSVGDVTFYRGRGQQIARARNRNPKNPRSSAQTIQRMILATASKAYSRLKSITDHSFQGVSYGADSQSYFLRRAMDDIRNWIAQTIDISGVYPADLRDPLLYRGLAFPNDAHESGIGLLISEGSIPSVPAVLVTPEGGDPAVDHFGAVASGPQVADILRALGAQAGDQITAVGVDYRNNFGFSRYVIKDDATAEELAEEWASLPDGGPYDEAKTLVGNIQISVTNAYKIQVVDVNRPAGATTGLNAAAIIISRKVGDVWQRSTQRLVWLLDAGDITPTDTVVQEWSAGTVGIDTDSPYYLNNADD